MLAPSIKNNQYYQRIGKIFLKFISRLFPKSNLISSSPGLESKNPKINEDWLSDVNYYKEKQKPLTLANIVKAQDLSSSQFELLVTPWLCVQGGMDKFVDYTLAFELEARSLAKDKKVLFYENLWHSVPNESEIFEIIKETKAWILERA